MYDIRRDLAYIEASDSEKTAMVLRDRMHKVLPAKWRASHGEGNYDVGTGLYLHGSLGTGKTYEAAGIAAKCISDTIEEGYLRVWWVSTADWLFSLRASYNGGEELEMPLYGLKLLVIDDIGVEKPSDWAREALYVLVNRAYEAEIPTVVTSNLGFGALSDHIGPRIVDRLVEMCRPIEMGGPSRRVATREAS